MARFQRQPPGTLAMRLCNLPVMFAAQGGEMRFFRAAFFARGDYGAVFAAAQFVGGAGQRFRMTASGGAKDAAAARISGESRSVMFAAFHGNRRGGRLRVDRRGGEGVASALQKVAANPADAARRSDL